MKFVFFICLGLMLMSDRVGREVVISWGLDIGVGFILEKYVFEI